MRNTPLKAFASTTKDVDTKLADRVYTKEKVDESLKKKGLHTEGDLRGKKDTTPKDNLNAGNNMPTNPGI